MNWISEWALPKIKTLFGGPREVPDNLWDKCSNCEQMIFHRDLERALHVCPHCGHHMRIGAKQRLDFTLDPGWQRIELPRAPADPLRFRDQRRYADRLKDAQSRSGQEDAVVVAHGAIEGHRVVCATFEFAFLGGSMGAGVGEALVTAARLAVLQDSPLVVFTASGGARMQEGAISLMQMPRTVIAARMVKEAGLPLILVLCDPTTGGVTASFAMLGDVQIAEPGALIGFAGARVIEQTVREKLPEGFQRAEYLLEHGILDMVVKRGEMRATLARLIGLLRVPEGGSEAFEQDVEAEPAATAAISRAEAIIERLHGLHPKLIDLSLGRMRRALAALGHPERALPPVLHVAGTNGKGSCCAFLRAIAETAGQRVHVYTSPHLVRFHERIRLSGTLVDEDTLESVLAEVEEPNAGAPITVFEITTAAALLLFSRVPADLLVLETGLGGRYDATNVVDRPAATAITSISMDHMEFLGDTLDKIAWEKAGILKPGVPCAVGADAPLAVLERAAAESGAPLLARGRDWRIEPSSGGGLRYADASGALDLPPPSLAGPHQADNAGIAVAALRAWNPDWLGAEAIAAGLARAEWPARMQRLRGRLAASLPPGWELWLDGGHNPAAGLALAAHLRAWRDAAPERPIHLVVGMKGSKAASGFLAPLLPPRSDTVWAVAEPGQHLAMPVAEIVAASGGAARPGPTVAAALSALPRADGPPARVLICGSLYLAGEVLKADNG